MEGFSYIAICQIAEGFGKRSVVPNGIRRGGFAHSRKTGSFKVFTPPELISLTSVSTRKKLEAEG